MSKDFNLELGSFVFDASAVSKAFIEAFDELLLTDLDSFELDRSTIEAIRQVLGTNTMLAVKLYEQNQEIGDQIEDFVKKNPPKK